MTSPRSPRLIGHRGAAAERPENTMVSFERALEIGVDVLETDVHQTGDGHIVISHDATGMRAAGVDRAIAQCSLAEVQTWDAGSTFVDPEGKRSFAGRGIRIPTLAELLAAAQDVRLNLDIKPPNPGMVGPVLALLDRFGAAERVTLASFHRAVIRAVRSRGFAGQTVLCRDEVLALLALPERWLGWLGVSGERLQIPVRAGPIRLASRRFIDRCHRLGLAVDYWTVNDPIAAEVLLHRGADGVMTDDPAAIKPVFERFGRQRLPG